MSVEESAPARPSIKLILWVFVAALVLAAMLAWLLAPAIPVMLLAALSGSGAGSDVGAPNLLVPTWCLLFGSLAWNFFEFGLFHGGVEWALLLCGAMSAGLAFPALLPAKSLLRADAWRGAPGRPGLWWWTGCYLGLFSVGASLGVLTYALIG